MNAKEELLEEIKEKKVKCIKITYSIESWVEEPTSNHDLPVNFTVEQYQSFIKSLDFDYDEGFGGQELYGVIWYLDGAWSTRGEYDGSEWWEHQKCPTIPEALGGQK